MAWPVYSTRFVLNTNSGSVLYTVPAGHRAVVKGVSSFNSGSEDALVYLGVGGPTVWAALVPAQKGVTPPEAMLVAFAGEAIELINQSVYLRSIACGYLFVDDGSSPLDDAAIAETPYGQEGAAPFAPA